MVYSTRRFVVCLTMCHFVLVFFSPFSIAITSLREERANLSAFRTFVRFVLVWFCRFPLPLGVWEGLRFVIVTLPGLFSYPFFLTGVLSFCENMHMVLVLPTLRLIHLFVFCFNLVIFEDFKKVGHINSLNLLVVFVFCKGKLIDYILWPIYSTYQEFINTLYNYLFHLSCPTLYFANISSKNVKDTQFMSMSITRDRISLVGNSICCDIMQRYCNIFYPRL